MAKLHKSYLPQNQLLILKSDLYEICWYRDRSF